MAAAGALVQMATHGSGAASRDGKQHLAVQPGEPGGRPIQESVARCVNQIGQLQEWPFHVLTRCDCLPDPASASARVSRAD